MFKVLLSCFILSTLVVFAKCSSITHEQICKAGIATLSGQSIKIMKSKKLNDYYIVKYKRKDGIEWFYKCKIGRQNIDWGAEPGRWRFDKEDEKLSYFLSQNNEEVTIFVAVGNSQPYTTKTFKRNDLK